MTEQKLSLYHQRIAKGERCIVSWMPKKYQEQFKKLCAERGVSMSEFIATIIAHTLADAKVLEAQDVK